MLGDGTLCLTLCAEGGWVAARKLGVGAVAELVASRGALPLAGTWTAKPPGGQQIAVLEEPPILGPEATPPPTPSSLPIAGMAHLDASDTLLSVLSDDA